MAVASGFSDNVKESIHAIYFLSLVYAYGRRGLVIQRLRFELVSCRIASRELIVFL